jgi:hypothetical protein
MIPNKESRILVLAKEKLDWEPRIKLEEGSIKTIDYFREVLNGGKYVQKNIAESATLNKNRNFDDLILNSSLFNL